MTTRDFLNQTPEEILRQIPWTREGYLQVRQIHAEAVGEEDDPDTIKRIRQELHVRSLEHGNGILSCQECGKEYDPKAGNEETWDGRLAWFWRDGANKNLCRECFKEWGRRETRKFFEYWHTVPEWERRKILHPGND